MEAYLVVAVDTGQLAAVVAVAVFLAPLLALSLLHEHAQGKHGSQEKGQEKWDGGQVDFRAQGVLAQEREQFWGGQHGREPQPQWLRHLWKEREGRP